MSEQRRYRILAVVADAATRRGLEEAVAQSQWDVEFVYRVEQAKGRLREGSVPVVICEGPGSGVGDWRSLLLTETAPLVVVISRLADDALWQEVLRAGGYDVLEVPFARQDLFRVLEVAGSLWRNGRVTSVREKMPLLAG